MFHALTSVAPVQLPPAFCRFEAGVFDVRAAPHTSAPLQAMSSMTPVMMSEPLSRKLSAGKPFTARAFYRSGLPPRASRMHTRRMSASTGVSHSPAATVRTARSCAYPRVGPLLHSDSTIPEGCEVPVDSAALEGGTPSPSGGAHYFRAPPSSLLSDSSVTSTETDGQSSSMLTASVHRSASLVADSSRLRMSDGSHSSSGAVEPLMAVGTDSGDIDSARGRDRRGVGGGTPSGVGASAGGVWPWFAVMTGGTPRGAGDSDAGSDADEHAQVCCVPWVSTQTPRGYSHTTPDYTSDSQRNLGICLNPHITADVDAWSSCRCSQASSSPWITGRWIPHQQVSCVRYLAVVYTMHANPAKPRVTLTGCVHRSRMPCRRCSSAAVGCTGNASVIVRGVSSSCSVGVCW